MKMLKNKTGQCMCGAVTFRVAEVPADFGVCHCKMCQRWTGSALLGVTVPKDKVVWSGEGNIATLQSSKWAKRGWCKKCGSGLYFTVTADSPYSNDIEVPIGLFDAPDDFNMTSEIYIDHKPESFAFAGGGRKTMTRQECVEKFGVLDSDDNI